MQSLAGIKGKSARPNGGSAATKTSWRRRLRQRQICFGIQQDCFALASNEARIPGRCNHGSVIGGKRAAREIALQSAALPLRFECLAEGAVRRYASRNKNCADGILLRCVQRARNQILHDGMLKARDEVKYFFAAQGKERRRTALAARKRRLA